MRNWGVGWGAVLWLDWKGKCYGGWWTSCVPGTRDRPTHVRDCSASGLAWSMSNFWTLIVLISRCKQRDAWGDKITITVALRQHLQGRFASKSTWGAAVAQGDRRDLSFGLLPWIVTPAAVGSFRCRFQNLKRLQARVISYSLFFPFQSRRERSIWVSAKFGPSVNGSGRRSRAFAMATLRAAAEKGDISELERLLEAHRAGDLDLRSSSSCGGGMHV